MCTTTEPWVCSSSTSPISPSSPNLLLLALPCDVSTPLHSTRCLLCQWQENWQLQPMLYTEWFRQGLKSVRSVVVSLRKCHTFALNFRAIQQNSSHHSTHRNSNHSSIRHRSNHRSRKCPWCMSVKIPERPILHPISSFSRPERPAFDVLPLCTPLAPWFALLVSLGFPLDFPLFSLLLP